MYTHMLFCYLVAYKFSSIWIYKFLFYDVDFKRLTLIKKKNGIALDYFQIKCIATWNDINSIIISIPWRCVEMSIKRRISLKIVVISSWWLNIQEYSSFVSDAAA